MPETCPKRNPALRAASGSLRGPMSMMPATSTRLERPRIVQLNLEKSDMPFPELIAPDKRRASEIAYHQETKRMRAGDVLSARKRRFDSRDVPPQLQQQFPPISTPGECFIRQEERKRPPNAWLDSEPDRKRFLVPPTGVLPPKVFPWDSPWHWEACAD